MGNITTLSRELAERPADEHFANMQEFLASAKDSKDFSVETTIDTNHLNFTFDDNGIGIQVGDMHYAPTRFAIERLNTILRFDLGLFGRLSNKTLATNLNELWDARSTMRGKTKLLVNTKTNRIRDVRETTYNPFWDYDFYAMLNEFMPNGMKPALPTKNSDGNGRNIKGNNKPALFRGDRDAICFWNSDQDNGGNANLGGLRQGFMAWNSEVRHRSIGYRLFLFREMCANFIIWDVSQVKTKRKYHTGKGEQDFNTFMAGTKRELMNLDTNLNPMVTQALESTMRKPFVANGTYTFENQDKAVEKLRKMFGVRMTKKTAENIVSATQLPENRSNTGDPALSWWAIVNGLTWDAKNSTWGSSLEESGLMAGELITASLED